MVKTVHVALLPDNVLNGSGLFPKTQPKTLLSQIPFWVRMDLFDALNFWPYISCCKCVLITSFQVINLYRERMLLWVQGECLIKGFLPWVEPVFSKVCCHCCCFCCGCCCFSWIVYVFYLISLKKIFPGSWNWSVVLLGSRWTGILWLAQVEFYIVQTLTEVWLRSTRKYSLQMNRNIINTPQTRYIPSIWSWWESNRIPSWNPAVSKFISVIREAILWSENTLGCCGGQDPVYGDSLCVCLCVHMHLKSFLVVTGKWSTLASFLHPG